MSELGLGHSPVRDRRKPKERGKAKGCLAVLVALAVLVGGGWFLLTAGVDAVKDRLAGPEDHPGPGHGRVLIEVHEGDTGADIGSTLEEAGVVASVEAFTDAATREPASAGIQVGYYQLKKEMRAEDALAILIDPANLRRDMVTIPEGLRVADIVALLAKETRFKAAAYEQVLDNPGQLGLPTYARGNAEGYLFPSTYAFPPDAKPVDILKTMVDQWHEVAAETGLEDGAAALGYTPHELMTVASLVEAEASGDYTPKVARVIYNRLETDGGPSYGLLELDATVNYAHGRNLGARTTAEDRQIDSPYNTYQVAGLPPGPIEAPGQAAIEAALHPADGPWYFYVTVNLRTGETKFAATLAEHNQYVEELNEYCRTESERC